MIIDCLQSPKIEITGTENLIETDHGDFIHLGIRTGTFPSTDSVVDFIKRNNGIAIVENEIQLKIYIDPFRTIPVFIAFKDNRPLRIFSEFEQFYDFGDVDMAIDPAGFWEIMLYESSLFDRTLYKNVKQMPGASCLIINKKTAEYSISRYWDFYIEEDSAISTPKQAADGLYERLEAIFDCLDPEDKYVLGLSGGMDSRITIAFLAGRIPAEHLKLFTYGFDPKIMEYTLACEVARKTGFNKPEFHLLDESAYRQSINTLPKLSGGQIGISHCHMFNYFTCKQEELSGFKNLSTYYTDAIFGIETCYPKQHDGFKNSNYIKSLKQHKELSKELKEVINEDIVKVLKGYNNNANYSSIEEYKYLVERHPKFFRYLGYMHGKRLPIIPLYTDFDLLSYCMSIPIALKQHKCILDYMFENNFKQLNLECLKSISTRDFKTGSQAFKNTKSQLYGGEWIKFKLINRINAVLMSLSGGRFRLFSKYHTEDQDKIQLQYFSKDLRKVCDCFIDYGLITEAQHEKLLHGKAGMSLNTVGLGALIGNSF
jgi:hypothetical protein